MNIYQKILEVKKIVKVFAKDAATQGKGAYKYVSGSNILSTIKSKMEEIGLLLIPSNVRHTNWTTYDYVNSYGENKTDFIVEGNIEYHWVNTENPEEMISVNIPFYGQQNDISKAFGSGLTYSERYLLLKTLGVPTDNDDPDAKTEDKPKSSQYAQIVALIKDSNMTMDKVSEWISKKFKKSIPINKLTKDQFELLCNAINKSIAKEVGNE